MARKQSTEIAAGGTADETVQHVEEVQAHAEEVAEDLRHAPKVRIVDGKGHVSTVNAYRARELVTAPQSEYSYAPAEA